MLLKQKISLKIFGNTYGNEFILNQVDDAGNCERYYVNIMTHPQGVHHGTQVYDKQNAISGEM